MNTTTIYRSLEADVNFRLHHRHLGKRCFCCLSVMTTGELRLLSIVSPGLFSVDTFAWSTSFSFAAPPSISSPFARREKWNVGGRAAWNFLIWISRESWEIVAYVQWLHLDMFMPSCLHCNTRKPPVYTHKKINSTFIPSYAWSSRFCLQIPYCICCSVWQEPGSLVFWVHNPLLEQASLEWRL